MGDVNDPYGYADRFERELERLEAHTPAADAEALQRWAERFNCAESTATVRLCGLRKLSEWADKPLVEFDSADDFYAVHDRAKRGALPDVPDDGLAASTLRNRRKNARLFFDFLGREWADEIHVGSGETSEVGPDDVLVQEEIDALLDVGNTRDRALVAFLTVTGQRISAALSIKVGDTAAGPSRGEVELNADAVGLKGASGPRPLLWSAGYISRWLDDHPRRDDPDAPLFCATEGGVIHGRRYEAGDALTPEGVRTRLATLAKRADVDPAKVNPHNFRHTAITRMIRNGRSEAHIKFMVGVKQDSDILSRYTHVRDREMLEGLRDAAGIASGDDPPEVGQPTLASCPNCGATLAGSERFCPTCGLPLTDEAQDVRDEARSDGLADLVDADDETRRELYADFLEFVDERADLLD